MAGNERSDDTDWRGVFAYLPTPLDASGGVDPGALTGVIDRCVDRGIHGLTPLGSSGELPYLDAASRRVVIETTVAAAAGRVPVVSGVGGFDLPGLVRDARAAQDAGSDGILLVLLAYFPLEQADVLRAIDAVASSVDVPLVLYNHPHLTHVDVTTETVRTAERDLGVRYVKDASGEIERITRWLDATDGRLGFFSATAVSPSAALRLGTRGWMSGPASLFTAESVAVYDLALSGDWEAATAAELGMSGALEVFRTLGPGRGIKAMFAASGMPLGDPVAPLAPLSDAELAWVRSRLARPAAADAPQGS